MKWLRTILAEWNDLVHGPGSLSERVERNATTLLWAVMALAVLLRLAFLFPFHQELFTRREKGFWFPAWNWVHGKGLGIAEYCPTSYRAPLYMFFVIPFFAIFGMDYVWPLGLAQAAVSSASVYLVYAIGKEWHSKRVGLLGALFMAIYPYNLYHDTQFYITFLFTFFLLLTVLGFLRLERTRSLKEAGLIGLWIGLAMLATSGPMVFFAPLACLWLWKRWGSFQQALKAAVVAAVVSLLVMAPWIVRNYNVHRAFVPLTTDAGRVFYKAYNPYALYMLLNNLHVDLTPEPGEGILTPMYGVREVDCSFLGMTELENEHYWYRKTFEWIKANPGQVPVLMTVKFVQLWRPWLWTPKGAAGENGAVIVSAMAMNWAYAFSFGTLLVLGAFEWLASSKDGRKRAWLFILLAIAFSITYSITYAFSKYRIPFDSVLAVLAAAGAWRLMEAFATWKSRKKTGSSA